MRNRSIKSMSSTFMQQASGALGPNGAPAAGAGTGAAAAAAGAGASPLDTLGTLAVRVPGAGGEAGGGADGGGASGSAQQELEALRAAGRGDGRTSGRASFSLDRANSPRGRA